MFINNTKPTGYKSNDRNILILNSDGTIFYDQPNTTGEIYFNLPKGLYETKNNLTPSEFRKYKLPNLAPHDKKFVFPKDIKIVVRPNKNKCSIDTAANIIYIDPSINKLPKNVRIFVLLHEVGHYLWKIADTPNAEKYCDTFACRKMLEIGFNPTQCYDGANLCLSDSMPSLERKILQMKNAGASFENLMPRVVTNYATPSARGKSILNYNKNR